MLNMGSLLHTSSADTYSSGSWTLGAFTSPRGMSGDCLGRLPWGASDKSLPTSTSQGPREAALQTMVAPGQLYWSQALLPRTGCTTSSYSR